MRVADLFAGAGGFSTGAELAGLDVVFAANHWPVAVAVHKHNHPKTAHACQDLQQFDFRRVPDHEILVASPACQGHSQAGHLGRLASSTVAAAHDAMRSTAWAVVSCAEAKQPRAIVVENVPEFREWRLFPAWRAALGLLGYHLTEQVLTASRWGVPQRRRRLFLIGRLDGPLELADPEVDEPPIRQALDFGAGEWTKIDDVTKPGARGRLEHARSHHRRCWGQHVSHRGAWGRSLDEPSSTVTTQNQHWLVDGERYRLWTVAETLRAMTFASDYIPADVGRTDAIKLAGNAVPPRLAAGLLEHVARSLS
jgi:DNA (cytosine-5)-methyltransferase 1